MSANQSSRHRLPPTQCQAYGMFRFDRDQGVPCRTMRATTTRGCWRRFWSPSWGRGSSRQTWRPGSRAAAPSCPPFTRSVDHTCHRSRLQRDTAHRVHLGDCAARVSHMQSWFERLFGSVQAYLEAMTRMFGACTQRTVDKFSAATQGGKVSLTEQPASFDSQRGHIVAASSS